MGNYLTELAGANLDVAFTPQINYWSGSSEIQLKMKDVSILS
jgi:single-stranded-DNA-specific exonuclease